MFDWSTFGLGLAVGLMLEAAIGAFVTAPLAVWYLKRNLRRSNGSILDDFLDNPALVQKVRQKFINAMFGGMGGRPPSLKQMGKTAMNVAIQEVMPGIVKRFTAKLQSPTGPLGALAEAQKRMQGGAAPALLDGSANPPP